MRYTIKLSTDIDIEVDAANEIEALGQALAYTIPQEALKWRATVVQRHPEAEPLAEIITPERPPGMLDDEYEEE